MFQIGQLIVYGVHGVCKIIGTENKKVDRKIVEYFVLESVQQPGAMYFVPTQNPLVLSKLRPVITSEELDRYINEPIDLYQEILCEENVRKQMYREWIASARFDILLSAVRAVTLYKQRQLSAGKKFHLCDETFLKDAEKVLCGEISIVLSLSSPEAYKYLNEYICEKEKTVCI